MKLDSDFLKVQTYANKLFDSLPVISSFKTQSDKDLIGQLQYSCVCYGRKLVSLFDKYQVIQKRVQENQSGLLVNLAQALNVAPNEASVMEAIQRQFKSQEQLHQKVEYLNIQLNTFKSNPQINSSQDTVVHKMLQHEQKLTEELQQVVDKLVKELKQSKDDKQILLDELKNREEQLKQLMSPPRSQQKQSNNSSTKKLQSDGSDRPRVRFQSQLSHAFQNLQHLVRSFLQQLVKPTEFNYDPELLLADEVSSLSMNFTNLLRDLHSCLTGREELLADYVRNIQDQCEGYLKQDIKKEQNLEAANAKIIKLELEYQKQQNLIKQAKDVRLQEVQRALQQEMPVFIIGDTLMDSELQFQIEKHNSKLQQQKEMTFGIKKKQENQYLTWKIGTEEGLSRIQILLQELMKMADSGDAQKLLKYCNDEVSNVLSVRKVEEGSLEIEVKQQRQTWLSQIEVLRKYFQEKVDGMVEDLEQQQSSMQKYQQISDGLHRDNEQLVKKLKANQQETLQLKEYVAQLNSQVSELDRNLRQSVEKVHYYEQLEKKMNQTQEHQDQEILKLKQQLNSVKKQKHQEHLDETTELTDRIKVLEVENKTYKKEIATIEEDLEKLKLQRQQQESHSENEKQQLRKHLEEKKRSLSQLHQENKRVAQESAQQINKLSDELQQLSNELSQKELEINTMTKTMMELEDFSRKQLEVIRSYEDKLTEAYQIKKSLEFNNQDNDQLLQQLQFKMQQVQQQNSQLRHENDKLLSDLGLLQKSSQKQLEQMLEDYKDKSNKQMEIHKILKDEARNLKAQLELKFQQLRQAEQDLSEKNSELDKAQKICKQLNTQISELRQRVDSMEAIKLDSKSSYDSFQLKNQQLQQEVSTLKKELQRQKSTNDQALQQELYNLRNEVRKMEQLLNQERQQYEMDLGHYQAQFQRLNMEQREQPPGNRQKSQSGSAFYENLIEAKDLEIARLTGIVKSLTDLRK